MAEVDYWGFQNSNEPDNEIEVTVSSAGVRFAVSDEQGMDSYNQTFTCEITLAASQARALAEWILTRVAAETI